MKSLNMLKNKFLACCVTVAERFYNLKYDQKGVTAVEYAIVVAGVAAVVSVIFSKENGVVETLLKNIFNTVETSVQESITTSPTTK